MKLQNSARTDGANDNQYNGSDVKKYLQSEKFVTKVLLCMLLCSFHS